MLLESAFHYLFCLKFLFKLITFSKSYARKQVWVFFFWTQCIRITPVGSGRLLVKTTHFLLQPQIHSRLSWLMWVNYIFTYFFCSFWCKILTTPLVINLKRAYGVAQNQKCDHVIAHVCKKSWLISVVVISDWTSREAARCFVSVSS